MLSLTGRLALGAEWWKDIWAGWEGKVGICELYEAAGTLLAFDVAVLLWWCSPFWWDLSALSNTAGDCCIMLCCDVCRFWYEQDTAGAWAEGWGTCLCCCQTDVLFGLTTWPFSAPWELPGDALGDGLLNVTCRIKKTHVTEHWTLNTNLYCLDTKTKNISNNISTVNATEQFCIHLAQILPHSSILFLAMSMGQTFCPVFVQLYSVQKFRCNKTLTNATIFNLNKYHIKLRKVWIVNIF